MHETRRFTVTFMTDRPINSLHNCRSVCLRNIFVSSSFYGYAFEVASFLQIYQPKILHVFIATTEQNDVWRRVGVLKVEDWPLPEGNEILCKLQTEKK